ncbi:MAG: SiaC family regulatory phosphoprotein [Marinoscillum sp.]
MNKELQTKQENMLTATRTHFSPFALTMEGFATQSPNLLLEPTLRTPYVNYNKSQLKLTIKGRSTDRDISEFYAPIISLLKRDSKKTNFIALDIHIPEMNTATLKVLFDLFRFLSIKVSRGTAVEVVWRSSFKNQEMRETGYDFSDLFDLNFRLISE